MSDLFRKGKSNFATTLVTGIGTGTGDTITLNSTTGLPTDTEITLTFNRVTSSGTVNSTTVMERITGTISGATLTSYTRGVDGTTEQAHAGGTVVEYIPNAADMNDQVDGILVAHNQDGTHKSGSVLTLPQINDTSADHKYIVGVSELAADRTVTLPLLTGNDEFVFKDHAQTLTNKTLVSPVITTSFDGWVALGAATYEASDDPTYTISFASDMTGVLSAGMRIKLTDSTVQYFIITGVGAFSGGKTIITLYGGTDYNLSGGAITLPYYSVMKAPFGFPLNPTKWTQALASLNSGNQTTPTQNVWYNTGSNSLAIPIGCWNIEYNAYLTAQINSSTSIVGQTTLSTANNSESDTETTRSIAILGALGNINIGASLYSNKVLTLTTKATYYLNIRTTTASATILYMNTDGYIKAVCAYL